VTMRREILIDCSIAQDRGTRDIFIDCSPTTRTASDKRSYDPFGRLTATKSIITAAQVNEYFGHEVPGWDVLGLQADRLYHLLRDPAALKKAVKLFDGLPLLTDHASVSAADPKPQLQVGAVHGCEWRESDGAVVGTVSLWDADAIRLVESGEKKELSAGYSYSPRVESGVFKGKRFDIRMLEIVPQHVSLVTVGRVNGSMVADAMPQFHTANVLQQLQNMRDQTQHERERSPLAKLFPGYYRI
jgi:uncharacterized protein